MPICQQCNHQWTWRETVKRFFSLTSEAICPNCHNRQYVTSRSRKKLGLLNFFPPVAIFVPLIIGAKIYVSLSVLVSELILMVSFLPYLIELENVKQ
ncbi:cxxc_20_cxxc protein [Gracilibacillus ureilyticus]|uniref:Cxxc_20_cxxc protein n=1 Tax=Gracilibacillus ureilyticus TaxID=531814 RepID=A0A1H9RUV0_9BACI|nr:TIGR04104 family putative zinc finger protein [Gracilibacillus ureilyticus]SER76427.1 cxxc_20_cxxc protein [Gracilibacillus ureilyticus]